MQLGIPAKLAPILFAQALSRLLLVYSAYSVIFAEALIILAGWHENNAWVMWAGFLVGFPGFVLWRLMFTPLSPLSASIYILFLSATLAIAAWAVLATMPEVESTKFLPFTLLGFALITACGVAARVGDRVLWALGGYLATNVALLVGAELAGKPYEFDWRILIGLIIVIGSVISTPRLLRANTKFQITLDHSAETLATDAERAENARLVAARLHDTVLAKLAVIATTKPGMLQDPLREALESQLALIETSDYSPEQVKHSGTSESADLTDLMAVISTEEAQGLAVNLGGTPTALLSLSTERREAMCSALAQCLANVRLHSGQSAVEVVILPAGDNLAVTVIDGGVGFDVDAVPEDRMGIKLSVRNRIESVGGSIRIWSDTGQGTAVMLQLPVTGGGDA
ncbi:sensor histidine kinase [Aurantimicrobium minutum]|uniref:sensor histidine kinase n=1 Tax=Aurantimicrobium minutum TaxID=708131 RepID=UPI002475E059|nr:ATP-binding protein [Aurantimicrobium minutum]MDH6536964.1 signal transduction histidine kinase [Aurantimicrobium minutum]